MIAAAVEKFEQIRLADAENPEIIVHHRDLCFVATAEIQALSSVGRTYEEAVDRLAAYFTSHQAKDEALF